MGTHQGYLFPCSVLVLLWSLLSAVLVGRIVTAVTWCWELHVQTRVRLGQKNGEEERQMGNEKNRGTAGG